MQDSVSVVDATAAECINQAAGNTYPSFADGDSAKVVQWIVSGFRALPDSKEMNIPPHEASPGRGRGHR